MATRRKLIAVPPFQGFNSSSVAIAAGGLSVTSIAAGAFANALIKSLQYLVISYAAGATSATGTLNGATGSGVTVGKTLLLKLEDLLPLNPGAAGGYLNQLSRPILTSATVATITRTNGTDAATGGGANIAGGAALVALEFF